MIEKLRNMDRRLLGMITFILVVIFILIIAMVLLSLISGGKKSYNNIEKTMVKAAKKYYEDNPSLLPKESGNDTEVDAATLSSGGYMKDLSEYTKGSSCSGKVIVGKASDNYDYTAYLNCGDKYKTALLYPMLIENTVTEGEGLYKVSDIIEEPTTLGLDDEGYDLSKNPLLYGYIYRGQSVNNYVKIGNELFRIVRIDGNNDLVIIQDNRMKTAYFDNRYNSETGKNSGINQYYLSRIYDYGKEYYNTKIKDDSIIKTKGVTKNICVGERSVDDTVNDGSIECSKVLKNSYYGLLSTYDVVNASISTECIGTGDPNCGNYNYLVDSTNFWLSTPSSEDTNSVFMANASVGPVGARSTGGYRLVFYLSNRVRYDGGTGTRKDPYIIK